MLKGLSNQEIGVPLRMAIGTVKVHASSILRSLRAKSRMHVVAAIWQSGITVESLNANVEDAIFTLKWEPDRELVDSTDL